MSEQRVCVLDIETLPGMRYFWNLFDENASVAQVIYEPCLLSWAAKFIDGPKIYSDILKPKEAIARDTKRIAISCWEIIDKADVVVGHNYFSFDRKYINAEFLKHHLTPLKYEIIDTLTIYKANCKGVSNKMAWINKTLGIRNKIDNDGFPLWIACGQGNKKALKQMMEYNRGDILATEALYHRLEPFVGRKYQRGIPQRWRIK